MEPLPPAVTGTLESVALIVVGYNLRKAGMFELADAQTAQKIAAYLTLPAAILHACNISPRLTWAEIAGVPVVVFATGVSAAIAWLLHANRHKRERALLAGCSVGAAAAAVALPFAEAALGTPGLVAASSVLLFNVLAVHGASYLLFGSAGPAFPESYQHADGGVYRGEWRGMIKEGLGVYKYTDGSRYEGEWRGNAKDGRGVYHYAKGGTYEGEWSGGALSGVGVRTYSSGKVVAGRWRDNKLEAPLELWQAAPAAEGAAEAALAARRVPVGGGRPKDAALRVAAQPAAWAAAAGLLLAAAGARLPSGAAAAAAALAPVNRPLMLISLGMLVDLRLPQIRQAADVLLILSVRLAVGLFLSANAIAFLGASFPATLPSLFVALLVVVSPVAPESRDFSRTFRLNEPLADAAANFSALLCVPLVAVAVAGGAAAGLLPVAGRVAGASSGLALEAAAASTPFATGLLLSAVAVCMAVGPLYEKLRTDRRVRLVYVGPQSGGVGGGSGDAAGNSESRTSSSSSSSTRGASASQQQQQQQQQPQPGPSGSSAADRESRESSGAGGESGGAGTGPSGTAASAIGRRGGLRGPLPLPVPGAPWGGRRPSRGPAACARLPMGRRCLTTAISGDDVTAPRLKLPPAAAHQAAARPSWRPRPAAAAAGGGRGLGCARAVARCCC